MVIRRRQISIKRNGDQATSDGSTPNPKATEPDDVLVEHATNSKQSEGGRNDYAQFGFSGKLGSDFPARRWNHRRC
jgi:hypothetical protein